MSLAETAGLVERGGGRALAIPGDVTAAHDVTRVVSTAESQLGPMDVRTQAPSSFTWLRFPSGPLLVNNAGVMGPVGYDWRAEPEDWWRTFEVNVLGSFRCAREVLAGMVAPRRGRIVNVSSGAAFNRFPRMTAYGATKAAVAGQDEDAGGGYKGARDLGVRLPPWCRAHVDGDEPDRVARRPKEVDMLRTLLNQGRDTPMERCTQMLLFLVSGRADSLSGRFIRTQDDEDELMRRAEEIQRNDLHTTTL